jgi:NADPH:quinone reductase-like Zn-dependent oxidoreductase
VLINGASGGIGTIAVQLAKAKGATVHAVCSGRNKKLVSRLGADAVLDYEQGALLGLAKQYDLVIDLVGNLKASNMMGLIRDRGTFVMVGYAGFKNLFSFMLRSLFTTSKKLVSIDAKTTGMKLQTIGQMVSAGKVKPVVDRFFPFEELPEAMAYLGTRRARGKVVIKMSEEG